MEEEKNKDTLEVSIIGSGFDRVKILFPINVPYGRFAYIKKRGEERELLVKMRSVSDKPADSELEEIRPASVNSIRTIMKNMARGYLWERNYEDVKVVDAELDIKVGHIRFLYIAEKKYTLTKIASQLAKLLHVKVEFKQIGARDFAAKIGGIGLCGRELCCKLFLKDIPSITLDMARKQYIFATPDKLSGACGRLLCCLRYELPIYEKMQEVIPSLGAMVETPQGVGKVIEVNIPLQSFKLQYEGNRTEIIYLTEEDRTWEVIKS